jgi:hypothetical protein
LISQDHVIAGEKRVSASDARDAAMQQANAGKVFCSELIFHETECPNIGSV